MSRYIRALGNRHLWIILTAFLICTALHYPQQLLFWYDSGTTSSFFGLSRHAVERILFLFPVVYAGAVFGLRGGIACMVLALAIMLPRLILITAYPVDAWFETFAVTVAGGLANWWLESRRRETGHREQALLKLETVRHELQTIIEASKEHEKKLATLHAISTAVNQSLDLQEVVNVAAEKLMGVVDIDAVLFFVLDKESGWLELKGYRGVSEEFAHGVDKLRLAEGFNGWVAQTGEPLFIKDSALDPRLSREVVKDEGLSSQFIVPLKSGDEVVGTLCMGVHRARQFTTDEKDLLRLIGVELGIAIQKARLYQETQLAMRRFQELFEKAHDAIWIQDLEGQIIDANQASAKLTGYKLEELIGKDIRQFITPHGLDLAREIQAKLILGESVEEPYELQIITKDGTEAILMVTTSLLGEKDMPRTFQHIARDITKERQLQDDLRLYIYQITRAHEEERSRIARELHDDTIQELVAVSHHLDTLASRVNMTPAAILKSVEQAEKDIDSVLQGIRRFTKDLRPPTLEYLGLLPALRELVSQVKENFDLDVRLKVNGTRLHCTKEEEILIYRIVQEALRNVCKHAKATRADVAIESNNGKTSVVVSDNGMGFDQKEGWKLAKTGKLGLIGMHERALLLNGTLEIKSETDKGTQVITSFPQ